MRYFLVLLIVLASCSGSKDVAKTEPVNYPEWVTSRPMSNEYYVGVAKSSKHNDNFQVLAKQNALMDLSSEISVKLSSESIFHQVDKGDSYREDYQALIQMESHRELEGYELVGTWENESEYWLYYKLSKLKWANIRADRKKKAINEAYSYFKLAEEFSQKEDMNSSVHYAVKALDALKMHMNEPLYHAELPHALDVHCFQFLSEEHQSIKYEPELETQYREVILMGSDISSESFDVYVGRANVPFKIRSSFKGAPERVYSDANGIAKVRVKGMDVYKKEHFIQFTLDWDEMVKSASESAWITSLLDFPENSFKITIQTVWPKISISSTELNLGEPLEYAILLNEAVNYFKEKGFTMSDSVLADYQINIKANTLRGLTNNRMHTALLQYEFIVKDALGKVIYQEQERELKGVQATFPTAGLNAYERSLDDFKWDVLRPFVKQLEGDY